MIHPTAIISSGVKVGKDVEIGPYSVVEPDVEIGDGCRIGPHVCVMRHTKIGAGCEVHAGAVLGDTPQDKGFSGCASYVEIGAKCVIREGVTIHRGTAEGSCTRVGDGCFLMANSHLAHNVVLDRDVILANGVLLGGHVHVGERAFVSGGVGVHQFVRIGRLAMVGGNSGCSKDVPPFLTVAPCSWNGVEGFNVVGMRRAGMDASQRADVKRIFKLIYSSGLNVSQALEQIDAMGGSVAGEISAFIRASKRGICGQGQDGE